MAGGRYDCHQEDAAISGPDDDIAATISNSAPSDFLEDAAVSGPDEDDDFNASSNSALICIILLSHLHGHFCDTYRSCFFAYTYAH